MVFFPGLLLLYLLFDFFPLPVLLTYLTTVSNDISYIKLATMLVAHKRKCQRPYNDRNKWKTFPFDEISYQNLAYIIVQNSGAISGTNLAAPKPFTNKKYSYWELYFDRLICMAAKSAIRILCTKIVAVMDFAKCKQTQI